MTMSATERQKLGHRRFKGWSGCSSSVRLAEIDAPSRPGATAIKTKDEEIPGQLRPKRSSEGASSDPTWVILNRVGARRDFFRGDRTTSATSHTSGGEQISVSLELVEPPGTSHLTLAWPQGPHPMKSTLFYPKVVAADRDAVLFEVTSRPKHRSTPMDYFIYRTSSDRSQPPSLSLPVCYDKGALSAGRGLRQRRMSGKSTGLLCSSTGSLTVAVLETRSDSPPTVDIYMLGLCPQSDYCKWQHFRCLSVCCAEDCCADDGPDLFWWSTDAVVPFRSCYLVWVDYYKGMIIGRMDKGKPELQYVSLPVDPVRGDPDSLEYGRGCPEASRSLCVAGTSLKFVVVNRHKSSFSITLWSMCDDYSWRQEATLDAGQLWALDSRNELPHVRPEFPIVSMGNPGAVCFLLNKGRHSADSSATTWMVEVHMKERRLLDVACYSKEISLADQDMCMTARMMSEGCSFISTQLPRYLPEEAMKRQECSTR